MPLRLSALKKRSSRVTASGLLYWFAEHGHLRAAELLLHRRSAWNESFPLILRNRRIEISGPPPLNPDLEYTSVSKFLVIAARNGHHKMVKLLVRSFDYDIWYVIRCSIKEPEVLKVLLEVSKSEKGRDGHGWYADAFHAAFRVACIGGEVEAVDLFLKAGVDPNIEFPGKQTVLHMTALSLRPLEHRTLKVIELLVKAGANPLALNRDGTTPLYQVAKYVERTMTAWLFPKYSFYGHMPLTFVAIYTAVDTLEFLVKAGTDPKYRQPDITLRKAVIVIPKIQRIG